MGTYDPTQKIWSGPPFTKIVDTNIPAAQILLNQLSKDEEKIAQINHDTDYHMTRREMRLKSLRIAEYLTGLGIKSGDVIQVILDQNDYVAPIVLGVICTGAILAPLHSSFGVAELSHYIRVASPKMIICETFVYNTLVQALKNVGHDAIVCTLTKHDGTDHNVMELLKGYEFTDFVPANRIPFPSDTALLLCTSGTTGMPKCVKISHEMFLTNFLSIMSLVNGTKLFNTSSLYWASGMLGIIVGIVGEAIRIFTAQAPTPAKILDVIENRKVNSLFTTTSSFTGLNSCLAKRSYDLSSLRAVQTGGAILSHHIAQEFRKYFKGQMMSGYGMTDVGGAISLAMDAGKANSTGKLIMGIQAKIMNDNGDFLGPWEKGEICVKTHFKCYGYMNNEEATQKAFREDGWVNTGDIGYFDDDGELYVVDRIKNMIKYKGFQIAPSELEAFITENVDIREVLVVGIPDEEVAFLPAALIIRSDSNPKVAEDDITTLIQENFSDAKWLRGGVYFVDEFPMTISEKYQRNEAQNIAIGYYKMKLAGTVS